MCARAYRKSYLSQVILLVATTKMSHVQEPSTANDTCVQTIDIANHIAYMIWLTAFKPNWNIQQILTHRTNSAAPVRWFTTFHTNKQTNKTPQFLRFFDSLSLFVCLFLFCELQRFSRVFFLSLQMCDTIQSILSVLYTYSEKILYENTLNMYKCYTYYILSIWMKQKRRKKKQLVGLNRWNKRSHKQIVRSVANANEPDVMKCNGTVSAEKKKNGVKWSIVWSDAHRQYSNNKINDKHKNKWNHFKCRNE